MPSYKTFVAFSLCNTKDKKARTTSDSHARKPPGKNTSHSKNGIILKGGKNYHFAKVRAKQNGHKWSIVALSLKIPKTYRNDSLKS